MKKFILFAAILFAGVSVVKAQTTTGSTSTTLNVILHPFQTISVNTATGHDQVELVYDEISDYEAGVSVELTDHLLINSTGAFNVTVKAEDLKEVGGSKTMLASTIRIEATKGASDKALEGATPGALQLSNDDQGLITSTTGGTGKSFNVKYTGAGGDTYTGNYLTDKATTTYSTTVLYTIAAQ